MLAPLIRPFRGDGHTCDLLGDVPVAIAAGDEHRNLHVPIGDGLGQRVVEHDVIRICLRMWRGREADQRLGRQITHGLGELRSEVAVVLVCDHNQVGYGSQVLVEAGSEVLVVVPYPPRGLRRRPKELLHVEHEQLEVVA